MNFYKKNMQRYGEQLQLDKLREECYELIDAIDDFNDCLDQGDLNSLDEKFEHLAEEMTDVDIVIRQFKTLPEYKKEIKIQRKYKIARQKARWPYE